MHRTSVTGSLILALGCAAVACAPAARTDSAEQPALKDVFAEAFLVGAAVNGRLVRGEDSVGAAIVEREYNTTTPENELKWERIHPEPGRYAFEAADRYVAFGQQNGMFVVGHTLVWHNQTPRWVFEDGAGHPASRDTLLGRMRDHIRTVVGRYQGRIRGWDVVNEALDEDGSLRRSPWLAILGDGYIAEAFRVAHEADPDAELYYNDYSLQNPAKRAGAVRLIEQLQAQGIPITGVGLQDHIHLDAPSLAQMDTTIATFAALGVKVLITELDVDVLPQARRDQSAEVTRRDAMEAGLNPYPDALPDSVQQALAQRYHDVFAVYLKHRDAIARVTFWGVTDAGSWKNDWPVRGRTNYPLLFDRAGRPKPAFDAVVRAAREATEGAHH
jgi:endo-1,4-beta-xylanase